MLEKGFRFSSQITQTHIAAIPLRISLEKATFETPSHLNNCSKFPLCSSNKHV